MTFKQLANADPQSLEAGGIEGVGVDLPSWIEQARTLAGRLGRLIKVEVGGR